MIRIFTGNRCDTCTQFRLRWTFGNPCARLPPSSGATPYPTESTSPSKCTAVLLMRYTVARVPGLIFASSVSRRFAMTYHRVESMSVNTGEDADAN
ncbi:hypothetical protein D3C72_1864950 [compost metagenome]